MSTNCTHYACRNRYECEYELKVRELLRRVGITYFSDEQIAKLADAWGRQENDENAPLR
jgi:hypothetical protein